MSMSGEQQMASEQTQDFENVNAQVETKTVVCRFPYFFPKTVLLEARQQILTKLMCPSSADEFFENMIETLNTMRPLFKDIQQELVQILEAIHVATPLSDIELTKFFLLLRTSSFPETAMWKSCRFKNMIEETYKDELDAQFSHILLAAMLHSRTLTVKALQLDNGANWKYLPSLLVTLIAILRPPCVPEKAYDGNTAHIFPLKHAEMLVNLSQKMNKTIVDDVMKVLVPQVNEWKK